MGLGDVGPRVVPEHLFPNLQFVQFCQIYSFYAIWQKKNTYAIKVQSEMIGTARGHLVSLVLYILCTIISYSKTDPKRKKHIVIFSLANLYVVR